ncbi:hypothetical protein LP420_19440 [Massilia sp. B-10]|nr:hypothetical protein LP420_19440 [Massilia sp. B-10]
MTINSGYQLLKPWIYLPLHTLFMGELWTLTETPPWLVPYWSLGFEVWYYVLFGVMVYARGLRRVLLGGLVLLIMGPKLWLLLPVWLAWRLALPHRAAPAGHGSAGAPCAAWPRYWRWRCTRSPGWTSCCARL